MAKATVTSSTLQINFKVGQTTKGVDQLKNEKFTKVKAEATNDDIFAVGSEISGLYAYPLVSLVRIDDSLITNQ